MTGVPQGRTQTGLWNWGWVLSSGFVPEPLQWQCQGHGVQGLCPSNTFLRAHTHTHTPRYLGIPPRVQREGLWPPPWPADLSSASLGTEKDLRQCAPLPLCLSSVCWCTRYRVQRVSTAGTSGIPWLTDLMGGLMDGQVGGWMNGCKES